MGRPSGGILLGFLLIVLGIEAGLLLGNGILLIDQHEGDALHVLQIALRMGQGEWPHLDFTTPIGVLAFAPVAWLISLGAGAGQALMGAGLLVALVMLPAIWWVGYTRLPGLYAYVFGAFLIILCTALVYGGPIQVASVSMFYNRWAWAAGFLLITLAILPSDRGGAAGDGLVTGLAMAFLLLSKVTFFAALLPGVLLALILRRNWSTLLIALGAGLTVVAVMTLVGGVQVLGRVYRGLAACGAFRHSRAAKRGSGGFVDRSFVSGDQSGGAGGHHPVAPIGACNRGPAAFGVHAGVYLYHLSELGE